MPKKKAARKKRQPAKQKLTLIYHDMAVYEDFERAAHRIFELVRECARTYPGKPRALVLEVQGHRNEEGGFDHDAWELMRYFLPEQLFPYLTELWTPLMRIRNGKPQREDVPDVLTFFPPLDGSPVDYDVEALSTRNRPEINGTRTSAPSVAQIARYLGLSEPCCLVCWAKPVERAHALPRSLTGSNSLANFALLCHEHHLEAPDVADSEAFWKWIDYAAERDSGRRMALIATALDITVPEREPRPAKTAFFTEVMAELKALYEWRDEYFRDPNWAEIFTEHYNVLQNHTGKHFGVDMKVSTHAWALDVARRRVLRKAGATDQEPVEEALRLVAACRRGEASEQELADHCLNRLVPVMTEPRDAERVRLLFVNALPTDREFVLQALEMTAAALRPSGH